MTKKHFIALADNIKAHNKVSTHNTGFVAFTDDQLGTLVDFCLAQNSRFDVARWLGYIAGTNGKNGGKIQ
jgi:hypothetical protein